VTLAQTFVAAFGPAFAVAFAVAFAAVLFAAAVSGLTGFGLALIAVPPLLLVYDPATVVVLIAATSLLTNTVIVLDAPRRVRVREILALLPWALAGLLLGTEVLRVADPDHIRLAAGVLVVVFAAVLMREVGLPGAGGRWGTALAGTSSGLLSTSTGLAGPRWSCSSPRAACPRRASGPPTPPTSCS
jgi:uncharacterized protein